MATEQNEGAKQSTSNSAVGGWAGRIEERYKKMKDHAEAYPYVWASYAVVYGGFGLWFAYRWRRLRKTEDRVRGLQRRLKELVDADAAGSSAASSQKPLQTKQNPLPTYVDKPPRQSF